MVQNRNAQHTCRKTTADGVRSAVAGNNFSKKKTLKTIGLVLRPQGGKNAFDFCGGLMANTANLHCIGKNIAHVCADGFSSSAGILVNSLVLAKMKILQNARCVWLRAGVFAIRFEHMGKEHRPRRRGLKARSNGRERQARVRSTYLLRLCDALPQPRLSVAF